MKKNAIAATIILGAFLLIELMRKLHIFPGSDGELHSFMSISFPSFFGEDPTGIIRTLWRGMITFTVIGISMSFIYPVRKIWSELGLGMNGFLKGWAIGTALCIPMFITNAIAGEFVFSWEKLFFLALWPGFFEEVAYRGFPFGPLYRKCKWNFFLAILVPTIIFASSHLYQAHDFMSALTTLTVTGLGSILFAWLYIEWEYNLWVPIALHAMMDAAWSLFPVGEENYGASGNTITNVGRVVTLLLAIGITLWHKYHKQKA